MKERPTIAIDAQTAATVVHRFDAYLAERIAPQLTCDEVKAVADLLTECGGAPNVTAYWVGVHQSEGDCTEGDCPETQPCPGCGAGPGEPCTPLSMCGPDTTD